MNKDLAPTPEVVEDTEVVEPTGHFGSVALSEGGLTPEQIAELERDAPELMAMLAETEGNLRDQLNGEEDNPLIGDDVPTLIKKYLSCIPQGVRWLSEKASVPQVKVEAFLEGDEEVLTIDEASALINVIVSDHERDLRRQERMIAAGKMPVEARASYPEGANRKERRRLASLERRRNKNMYDAGTK